MLQRQTDRPTTGLLELLRAAKKLWQLKNSKQCKTQKLGDKREEKKLLKNSSSDKTFIKNNLTPQQQMRCSLGSVLRFLRRDILNLICFDLRWKSDSLQHNYLPASPGWSLVPLAHERRNNRSYWGEWVYCTHIHHDYCSCLITYVNM